MKTLKIETVKQWQEYEQGLIDVSQYDLVVIDQKLLKFINKQAEEKLLKEAGNRAKMSA